MQIILTIESDNFQNVAHRTATFDTERILNSYANTNTCDGTTIVEYAESASAFSNNTRIYGVTETTSYIAAGGQTSANTTFTVKKKIGWSGATGMDFLLPATVDTAVAQIDLGAIVPAFAKVVDVQVITKTGSVFSGGATTLTAGIGNVTGGAQFLATGTTIYAINAIVASTLVPARNASASHVWLTAVTPGANWSTQTAGEYDVYVTYIDASSL
jgi:hypothetical protein